MLFQVFQNTLKHLIVADTELTASVSSVSAVSGVSDCFSVSAVSGVSGCFTSWLTK